MDSLQRAIDAAGGLSELARKLNVSPQVIANWRRRKRVPSEYLLPLERESAGHVKVRELLLDLDSSEGKQH